MPGGVGTGGEKPLATRLARTLTVKVSFMPKVHQFEQIVGILPEDSGLCFPAQTKVLDNINVLSWTNRNSCIIGSEKEEPD